MVVPLERIEPDPAAYAALTAAALPYDADDADSVLTRLAAPPAERPSIWLAAGNAGLAIASLTGTVGHLDLIAVSPATRRRGLGTELLRGAEDALRTLGATELRWAGNPPCYAWPGIDVRYTAAVCLALAAGYQRYDVAQNMTADLATADLSTSDDESRLVARGVTIGAAAESEVGVLANWVEDTWNVAWRWEVEQAVRGGHGGCHVAWRNGVPLAFAAYGGNRADWFGPMGTDPAARNLGLGRVLLRRCLADLHAAGRRTAQISWVGPIAFYSRTVGARLDRIFWLYRKAL